MILFLFLFVYINLFTYKRFKYLLNEFAIISAEWSQLARTDLSLIINYTFRLIILLIIINNYNNYNKAEFNRMIHFKEDELINFEFNSLVELSFDHINKKIKKDSDFTILGSAQATDKITYKGAGLTLLSQDDSTEKLIKKTDHI